MKKEQNESACNSNETPSSIVDLSLPSDNKFSESEDEMLLDLSMGFTFESYL